MLDLIFLECSKKRVLVVCGLLSFPLGEVRMG